MGPVPACALDAAPAVTGNGAADRPDQSPAPTGSEAAAKSLASAWRALASCPRDRYTAPVGLANTWLVMPSQVEVTLMAVAVAFSPASSLRSAWVCVRWLCAGPASAANTHTHTSRASAIMAAPAEPASVPAIRLMPPASCRPPHVASAVRRAAAGSGRRAIASAATRTGMTATATASAAV